MIAYIVERGAVPLVGCEPCQSNQLVAVLVILHSAQLEDGPIGLHGLFPLFGVFLRNAGEKLDETLENNAFQLSEETRRLKCLAGDVESQVLS